LNAVRNSHNIKTVSFTTKDTTIGDVAGIIYVHRFPTQNLPHLIRTPGTHFGDMSYLNLNPSSYLLALQPRRSDGLGAARL
jgi:hypothetical protein